MKKISIGILAHVDAGKTTLTESLLYLTGVIRTQGRVDRGDAFLDTEALEKKRGVTIYSKQAVIDLPASHILNRAGEDVCITIIDTPGHTDFVGETERALSVLDLAVLIISAPDGVTDQGRKLVSMLRDHKVPYAVFVNKMDMPGTDESRILDELERELGPGHIALNSYASKEAQTPDAKDNLKIDDDTAENIASLSESLIEKYLLEGSISNEDIIESLYSGLFHPVIFGCALKNEGTADLISLITMLLPEFKYRNEPSARVFKIAYEDGHKLSFMKVTGGEIAVRETLPDDRLAGEKITQIRRYSGGRFETLEKAVAGDVITVIGVEQTFPGMGIGGEIDDDMLINRPVLRYRMILPSDVSVRTFLPKLKELSAEDPLLQIEAQGDSIGISVMGEFQLEIITATIEERFEIKVRFDKGEIIYKETIADAAIGFGHFEPLRHYAEVQLLLEPLPDGSGIEVASAVSVDELGINWQRNIMSVIMNDLPTGVLTGSELTDIRFTLVAGRSHVKHTEGGDFREAVRRAVRQGMMKAGGVLLEPYYEFHITLPSEQMGRAMNDINMTGGTCAIEHQNEQITVLKGEAPARELINYQAVLTAYTSGQGRIELGFAGYRPCPEDYAEKVIEESGYDPDSDADNPSGSVFVSHGAGEYVPWYECEARMHTENREAEFIYGETETEEEKLEREAILAQKAALSRQDSASLTHRLSGLGTEEIDQILKNSSGANAVTHKGRSKRVYHTKRVVRAGSDRENAGSSDPKYAKTKEKTVRPKYLLVDGYNIIHAWDELKSLLGDDPYSLDGAKYRLLDILSEYRVVRDTEVIAVFDAYKVKGHVTEKMDYMGVHVVYTKEAETADQYIARFTVVNSKFLDISVATSDGLVQLIIRGENCRALSASDLLDDVKRAHAGQ